MYPTGNIICVMLLLVQNLLFDGFGEAFGILANIFKKDNLFMNYCKNVANAGITGDLDIVRYSDYDTNDTFIFYDEGPYDDGPYDSAYDKDTTIPYDSKKTYDYYGYDYTCTGRDMLFANVGVAANIFWAIFVFSGACLLNRLGLFRLRIIVFVISFIGIVSFALVPLYEPVIWVALPFVHGAGSLSLMLNQFHVRAMPGIQFTLITLLSGCFRLSSAIPVVLSILHFQYLIPMTALFTALAVVHTVISLTIILVWTPAEIPQTVPTGYSLWNESVTRKVTWDHQKKPLPAVPLWIFKTSRFYILFLASSMYAFRIFSFEIWMRSGWPEWVAGPEFGMKLHDLVGYLSFGMITLSIIPGVIIDLCRKILKDEFNGTRVGLMIITTTTFGGLILQR